MTIIEFYDKAAIENIASALLCRPDRVILIGDSEKKMTASIKHYTTVLRKNGIQTEFFPKPVPRNNLEKIVEVFSEIVEANTDCIFDLTGGDELYLVAVGVILNRYEGRVSAHRFNLQNDTLHDCDSDGTVCSVSFYDISIEDNILIHGGHIVTDPTEDFHTYPWEFTPGFACDIENMWNICRADPQKWNKQIGTIRKICERFTTENPENSLKISFYQTIAKPVVGDDYLLDQDILFDLQRHGVIQNLVLQDRVSFVCKNEQIKKCLTLEGQVLELIIASKLRNLTEKDGQPLYHDVRVGLVLDWDAAESPDEYRTTNEIDVVAMKSVIPVFISCKNGNFDANELYKLNAVAERFGTKYVKKVLITTCLSDLGEKANFLRARMGDMGIHWIEITENTTEREIDRALKDLWRRNS